MTIEVQASIVMIRWNKSACWKDPTKIVISATKPLSPGNPSEARPAMT